MTPKALRIMLKYQRITPEGPRIMLKHQPIMLKY